MSKALRINFCPDGDTVKLSLRCELCGKHICYLDPHEAALMSMEYDKDDGIYCFECEAAIGLSELFIVDPAARSDLAEWMESYANTR